MCPILSFVSVEGFQSSRPCYLLSAPAVLVYHLIHIGNVRRYYNVLRLQSHWVPVILHLYWSVWTSLHLFPWPWKELGVISTCVAVYEKGRYSFYKIKLLSFPFFSDSPVTTVSATAYLKNHQYIGYHRRSNKSTCEYRQAKITYNTQICSDNTI